MVDTDQPVVIECVAEAAHMAEDQETENGGWNRGPDDKPQRLAPPVYFY